jgi:hypothetical protein
MKLSQKQRGQSFSNDNDDGENLYGMRGNNQDGFMDIACDELSGRQKRDCLKHSITSEDLRFSRR